ncbi:hypothetical protein HK102_001979, partial [Quaeritorhiza haematococci]
MTSPACSPALPPNHPSAPSPAPAPSHHHHHRMQPLQSTPRLHTSPLATRRISLSGVEVVMDQGEWFNMVSDLPRRAPLLH